MNRINDSAITANPLYKALPNETKTFLADRLLNYKFTFSETNRILGIASDLDTWSRGSIQDIWPLALETGPADRQQKKRLIKRIESAYQNIIESEKDYSSPYPVPKAPGFLSKTVDRNGSIMGDCPVLSDKTRCCGLKTLDAVINCQFGCTYCSISPFYSDSEIMFHKNLKARLAEIQLDPEKIYHIGTGQSSDSLIWGNRNGLLEDLTAFAREHPNVILELKSKAALPACLASIDIPKNMIATWSVNTDAIIRYEEPGTANLATRLEAAKTYASRGRLCGFHFHPIVYYRNWEKDYQELANSIMKDFDPSQIAMISLGTLTFIKPVIRQIRQKGFKTRILQMPLHDYAGKMSYPPDIKIKLFSTLYRFFEAWHGKVFFYLCMEPPEFWKPVFGFDYPSNPVFESEMNCSYLKKINALQAKKTV